MDSDAICFCCRFTIGSGRHRPRLGPSHTKQEPKGKSLEQLLIPLEQTQGLLKGSPADAPPRLHFAPSGTHVPELDLLPILRPSSGLVQCRQAARNGPRTEYSMDFFFFFGSVGSIQTASYVEIRTVAQVRTTKGAFSQFVYWVNQMDFPKFSSNQLKLNH